jgi:hypothetical protein
MKTTIVQFLREASATVKGTWKSSNRTERFGMVITSVLVGGVILSPITAVVSAVSGSSSREAQSVQHVVSKKVSSKPPVEGVIWSTQYNSWLCPSTELDAWGKADTYQNCTATDYPSIAEIKQTTEIRACIGRSGKEEQTAGWSWAAAQCREDVNAF